MSIFLGDVFYPGLDNPCLSDPQRGGAVALAIELRSNGKGGTLCAL